MSPSRESFVAAVQAFKRAHGKKLKEILQQSDLTKQFFENETIRAYLSRSAREVGFAGDHPKLGGADKVELKVYRRSRLEDGIPYRANAETEKFYQSGMSPSSATAVCKILKSIYVSDDAYFTAPGEIGGIRSNLNHVNYSKYFRVNGRQYITADDQALMSSKNLRFILSFQVSVNDKHAAMIFTIVNPNSRRILASIFINSSKIDGYYDYLKRKFNIKASYWGNDLQQEYMSGKLSLNINPSERVAYVGDNHEELTRRYADPNIDAFISTGMLGAELLVKRVIPLIDASHDLQLEDDDQNCALYSINFISAIGDMLKDPAKAGAIYALAAKVDAGDKAAVDQLRHIFQEDLKAYLPQYYRANGNIASYAYLKSYHLRQRWNVGSDYIAAKFPSKYAPITHSQTMSEAQHIKDMLKPFVIPNHPELQSFTKAIDDMLRYAYDLYQIGSHKGELAYDLTCRAKIMSRNFFSNDKSYIDKNLPKFKADLFKLLNSRNEEMSEYRLAWKTIIINIMIALTGIGSIALAGKLIYSKIAYDRPVFFFSKPRTTCEEKLDIITQSANKLSLTAVCS